MRARGFVVVCVALMSTACVLEVHKGDGVEVTQTREVSDFTRLRVSGGIDTLNVKMCDCTRIVVTTDSNLQDHIRTERDGDTMEIDTDGWLQSANPIQVTVFTPSLESIRLRGSTRGEIENVDSDSFEASVSGSSSLTLRGAARTTEFDTSGSSTLSVASWRTDVLELQLSGGSNMVLDAVATRRGKFDISGASEVNINGTGGDLEYDLSGASRLNAQEFRVRDVEAEVSGSSYLAMCAMGAVDLEASGASDIVYYCDPETTEEHLSGSSVVSWR